MESRSRPLRARIAYYIVLWQESFGTGRCRNAKLLPYLCQGYPSFMSSIVEVEKLALDLSERERAALAASLLDSLPGILSDEDEGIAEALRRNVELDADPSQGISFAELDSLIQSRRG
jgi:putative addiction module component (TIGR02574 family)